MQILSIITTIVVAIIGSGLIQWTINRRDIKADRLKRVEEKLEELAASVKDVQDRADRREAESIRRHILDFADQTRMGRDRSAESWRVALDDCKKYEEYCETHDTFVNGRTEMSIEQTRERYRRLFPMEVIDE